jgi:hypothetical protein
MTRDEYVAERDRLKHLIQRHTKTLAALKEKCPHDWQYHSDPSGNNDSFHDCHLCGKECKHP